MTNYIMIHLNTCWHLLCSFFFFVRSFVLFAQCRTELVVCVYVAYCVLLIADNSMIIAARAIFIFFPFLSITKERVLNVILIILMGQSHFYIYMLWIEWFVIQIGVFQVDMEYLLESFLLMVGCMLYIFYVCLMFSLMLQSKKFYA